jgi:PD-(D/E)XK nuclease superfamily
MPSFSPPTPNTSPYIWVTWLAPLLSGSHHCQWSAWFKANFKFDKDSDDSFLADWNMKHNALLNQRAKHLEDQGYQVFVEDENYFQILSKDKKTVISGKADIVAIKGSEVIVEDCKTGRKRDFDPMQVLLYMILLPAPGGPDHCRKKDIEGRLIYGDEMIDVPSALLTKDFKDAFRQLVGVVSKAEPARKVPSQRECRFCKISSVYCPERINIQSQSGKDDEEHDIF